MTALLWILAILGYYLVGCVGMALVDAICRVEPDAMDYALALVWPLSLPILFIVTIPHGPMGYLTRLFLRWMRRAKQTETR